MATDEEIYKFIAKVEGEEKVKDLGAKAALAEQKFKALFETLGAGHAATSNAAASLVDVTKQLNKAQTEASKFGGGASQALIQLGYAADDAQYGMKGLANNIQPILSSIPALAGLAPVISIAAIAVYQLYEHWDQLAALFGQGHVKTQAEEMEELRKKTSLTADEAERLARAQNLESKVKELRGLKTKDQQQEEAATTEAMGEAGFRNVVGGILKTAPDLVDSQGDAAIAKAKLDDAKKNREIYEQGADEDFGAGLAAAEVKVKEAEQKLSEARKKTAEQIAASGALPAEWEGQRERIADLAEKDPAAFGPNGKQLAKDLKAADPENAKEKAAQDYLDQQETDFASKKAMADEKIRIDDEQHEKDAEEYARKQEEDHENKRVLANERAEKDLATDRDKEAKEKVDRAKETPGIESAIKTQLKAMYQAGASPQEAQAALAGQLSDRFGRGTANALVAGQAGGAREELMSEYLNGDQSKHRNSQVIGAEGLAASIQSAVGGDDTQKKQLEQQKRAADYLQAIANAPRGSGVVGFNAQGNATVN